MPRAWRTADLRWGTGAHTSQLKQEGGIVTHTPLIYYWSSPTGNTKALADKLKHTAKPIGEDSTQPYVLLTPSYDQPRGGFIPKQVERFLEHNSHNLIGVIGTGNINFGQHYCQAAKDIAKEHDVPLLARVDLRGNENDINKINTGLDTHWQTLHTNHQHKRGETQCQHPSNNKPQHAEATDTDTNNNANAYSETS